MANESIRAVSRRVGRALGAITGQTGNINTGNGYGNTYNYVDPEPIPTFDPNSGDGYGPNQKLPPLCARFPSDYGPC